MKNTTIRVLSLATLLGLGQIKAQTSLFYENFEGGPSITTLTLNPAENGSVDDATGYNKWIINNAYTGGSGSLSCMGFPFTWSIGNSAAQPAPIINSPSSYYMHLLSDVAQSAGVLCSSFLAADGICNFAENHFARMTNDISTVGFSNITLSYYWMCGGGPNSYGELYYSTNSGSTWTKVTSPISNFSGQTTWTTFSTTNAAFDNQATLRFGWRFVNGQTTSAQDPSFSLDEISITGTAMATITTSNPTPLTTLCEGDVVAIPYSATGTFNGGNVFSVELSDALGSFASPSIIGTQASTATSGTIMVTIPSVPPGISYKVRVTSSSPAVVGTANPANLTIRPIPVFQNAIFQPPALCMGDPLNIQLIMNQVQTPATGTTYYWEESWDGTSWWQIMGISTFELIGHIISDTVFIRVTISNACGTDTTPIFPIYPYPPSDAGLISAQDTLLCEGDQLDLTQTGGVGTTSWQESSDGITWTQVGTSANTYSTTVTSASPHYFQAVSASGACGSAHSNIIHVTVSQPPVADFSWVDVGTGVDFTDLSTGTPTSWLWNFGDGNTSSQQNPSHSYASSGVYTVTLFVDNGACTDTSIQSVSVIVGAADPSLSTLRVFPQPSTGLLQIEGLTGGNTIHLVDLRGATLRQWTVPMGQYSKELQAGDLPDGVYFLQIGQNGRIINLKVILQH